MADERMIARGVSAEAPAAIAKRRFAFSIARQTFDRALRGRIGSMMSISQQVRFVVRPPRCAVITETAAVARAAATQVTKVMLRHAASLKSALAAISFRS